MSIQITDNVKTLNEQAPMTANEYMIAGIERIDRAFGEGYAKEHPELLGAFIEASATDFLTSVIGKIIIDRSEAIVDAIQSIKESR